MQSSRRSYHKSPVPWVALAIHVVDDHEELPLHCRRNVGGHIFCDSRLQTLRDCPLNIPPDGGLIRLGISDVNPEITSKETLRVDIDPAASKTSDEYPYTNNTLDGKLLRGVYCNLWITLLDHSEGNLRFASASKDSV